MEKPRELLEKALEIERSGDDALKEWYTELTADEQTEVVVQLHDALADLTPMLNAIMDQIKAFAKSLVERWSEIVKILDIED